MNDKQQLGGWAAMASEKIRVFVPPLEVAEEEGFDKEKDIFGRASFGQSLTNLVSISKDPLVLVLDSPWGTGKSTFIKMWAGQLRKEKFPVIHFDAFQNDHVENGYIALIAEVIRLATTLKKANTPKFKRFVKRAARAGSILLRTGAKLGVKAATLGAIDATDLEGLERVASDVATQTSSIADSYVENLLKLQSKEQETLASVRQALSEIASSLSNTNEPDGQKPIIFIVDELDRCRPSFALELLEKIKHIFSTPDIHFVLVADMRQLETSVKYTYGGEIDASAYLQKFYNLIVTFPQSSSHRNARNIPKYLGHVQALLNLPEYETYILESTAEARELSLRAIEKIASSLALARIFTPRNFGFFSPIIAGLCIIKVTDPELYRRIKRGKARPEDVLTALAIENWPQDTQVHHAFVSDSWIFALAENEDQYPNMDWRGLKGEIARHGIRDRRAIIGSMLVHLERFQLPT